MICFKNLLEVEWGYRFVNNTEIYNQIEAVFELAKK